MSLAGTRWRIWGRRWMRWPARAPTRVSPGSASPDAPPSGPARDAARGRVGVVFPQREIGNDPGEIATFARAAEELGYDHILVYEHVLGAERRGRESMKYDSGDAHHELFVLLGFLAGVQAFRSQVREAGRDPASVGIEAGVHVAEGDAEMWARLARDLVRLGVTHVNLGTMDAGLRRLEEHLAAMRRFRERAASLFGA